MPETQTVPPSLPPKQSWWCRLSAFSFGFVIGAGTMFTLCVVGLFVLLIAALFVNRTTLGYEPMPLEKVSQEDFVGTWFLASVETDNGVIYPGTDAFTLNADGTANVTELDLHKYNTWLPELREDDAKAKANKWKLISDFPEHENAVLEFRGNGSVFDIFVSDESGDIVLKKYLGDPDAKQFICWRKRREKEGGK